MASVGRLLRARASNVAKAKKEAAIAMRQRCLCTHQRRRHAYRGRATTSRPCEVAGCGCTNFILLQRSML